MALIESPRLERSGGPTLLSPRPVVRLQGRLNDPLRLAEAWPGLLERIGTALAAVGTQELPGGVAKEVERSFLAELPRTIAADRATEEAGRLLAAIAATLLATAGAPRGAWGTVKASPPKFLAYWDDWMNGAGRAAGQGALDLLEAACADPRAALEETAKTALVRVRERRVDGFLTAMIGAAEARTIPWRLLSTNDLVVIYGQGSRQRWVRATLADDKSYAGVYISLRKDLTNKLLSNAGFPVPRQRVVRSRDEAAKAAGEIGFPVVVKPLAGSLGKNTALWIESGEDAAAAYDACGVKGSQVLVEEQLRGEAFRVTVVDGKAIAAARHLIPFVVGDGRSSVKELIEAWNRQVEHALPDNDAGSYPIDMEYHALPMARRLKDQELALEKVPENGREVFLAYLPERAHGGISVDVTQRVHPDIMRMAEAISQVSGLRTLGLDLITTDIAKPLGSVPLGINEINACPHPRIHELADRPRQVGTLALAEHFPEGDEGRIPIALFHGFADPAVLDRLERLLWAAGWTPGVADPQTARIAGYKLRPMDEGRNHPGAAVLRDRRADAGLFGVALSDLSRRGLPSDCADVVAFAPGALGQRDQLLRPAASMVAALPGRLLLTALGEAPDWLRAAAASRRWIVVAKPEDGAVLPPESGEVVRCETGMAGQRRAVLCSAAGRELLCDRLDAEDAEAQLWSLAALLGLGFTPGEICRLALCSGEVRHAVPA